jgi:N-acetylmuramoyl-L-alanine amidase
MKRAIVLFTISLIALTIGFTALTVTNKGQLAVAFVTINRVKSGHFEDDICGVVKQKFKGVCQFTWYCENTTRSLTGRAEVVYNDVKDLAVYVYANYDKLEDPSKGALFYHADYVNPKWKNMEHLTTIGRHIFYIRKDLKWTS